MFKVFKTSGIEGSYSISSNPTFVNDRCWSVYSAKHKTTKKQCSVWEFNKRECENQLIDSGVINKQNKKLIVDDIYERLKVFVSNQSRLKHPNFLTVIEPFEDHKSRILFVTEYVKGDLRSIDKTDLDGITITKGILQVSLGLKFLHDQMKSVHLNISPASIVITDSFDWKITGLSFMETLTNGVIEKYIDPLDSRLPTFLSIDFRFSSPNLISKHRVDYINDIFSLCLVIYYLFQYEILIKCPHSSSISDYERQITRLNQVLDSGMTTQHALFNKLPSYYYTVLIEVLKRTQESNTDVIQLNETYTIDHFIGSSIFNNPLIKMLTTIDEFPTMSPLEKVSFLQEMQLEVEKFPKTLILNKIIPILTNVIDLNLFKKNKPQPEEEELLIAASENLIKLSKNLSQLTFSEKVFPFMNRILTTLDFDGYKIVLIKNLVNFQAFIKSSSRESTFNETFSKFLIELFQRSTTNDSMILQELILANIKVFLDYEPYNTITNVIYPTTMTIYSTTTSLKVKNNAINSFIVMISGMNDKNLDDVNIIEKLIPLIQATSQSNFANSKFLLNMLSLYEIIFIKLTKSSCKTIQIQKKEIDYLDLIMTIGFEVWKLTKFVKFKQDLNKVYKIWSAIEFYLKDQLNANVTEEQRDRSYMNKDDSPSPIIATPNSTPVAKHQLPRIEPNLSNKYVTNNPMPVSSQYNVMKPSSSISSSSFPVMKSKNDVSSPSPLKSSFTSMKPSIKPLNLVKEDKKASASQLSFGQTQTQTQTQTKGGIDWSSVNNTKTSPYSLMQPMKSKSSSQTSQIQNVDDDDNWDDFTSAPKSGTEDKWASLI